MNPNNNLDQQFNEEESGFDIMQWVGYLLHYWYLFAIFIPLGLGFGYVKNLSWIPSYRSTGKVMIEESRSASGSQAIMQGFGLQRGYRNINNQAIMLSSHDLIGKVVDSLPHMKVDYVTQGRFKTKNIYHYSPIRISFDYVAPEIYGYLFKISLKDDGTYVISHSDSKDTRKFELKGKYEEKLIHDMFSLTVHPVNSINNDIDMYFRFNSRDALVSDFLPRLNFSFVAENSSVLGISLVSETPDRDVDFINKLMSVYLSENLNKKNDAANKTIKFINEQLKSVSASLSESEDGMTKFRQQHQIVDVSSYTAELLGKASGYDAKISELKLRETYLIYLEEYLRKNLEDGSIMAPSSLGLNEPMLMNFVSQLNELYTRRSETSENNPYYAKYSNDIENAKLAIQEVIKSMKAALKIERDDVNNRNAKLQKEIELLPTKELAMIAIERQYRVDDNYYTFFLQKRAEAEIQKASNSPDNEILDKARIVALTNSGTKSKNLTTYLLIGLIIPCVLIFAKEILNNTVRSAKDMEKNIPYPMIGTIRHTRKSDPVLAAKNPRSSFAEMFRVIRTRLEFITQRKADIMIAVTSTESGDGKTYFCTNLASVYAMTKRPTILVDMDIRKPSVIGRFNVKVEKGLTDYLIGDCTLDDVIVSLDEINYDILPGGTIPPNPGEIIRSDKLKELFSILRTKYEYIILDTSPIGLVADAYALVDIADVSLFVVRYEKTNKAFFKKLLTQLKSDKVERLYTVLNDISSEGNSSYGKHDSYGYGYGYGYGSYGSKSRKRKNHYYEDNADI